MPTYPTYFLRACHRNQTFFFIWPKYGTQTTADPFPLAQYAYKL